MLIPREPAKSMTWRSWSRTGTVSGTMFPRSAEIVCIKPADAGTANDVAVSHVHAVKSNQKGRSIMRVIVRCGAAAISLFFSASGIAAERNAAAVPKPAIDALLARLDNISHDPEMTTAKKAIVAADAIEKFNQQQKGKTFTVRLKVQDVVPAAQGHYLTANRPDLDGVQFYTAKFQTSLSNAEVMSITKESVLVVTGVVSAGNQPPQRIRSEILKPGSSVTFPLHANPVSQLTLENISYQLEAAPQSKSTAFSAGTSPASDSASKTTGGVSLADKLKNEQLRSVDDVKLFFLKGILQNQHPSGNTSTAATGKAGAAPAPA